MIKPAVAAFAGALCVAGVHAATVPGAVSLDNIVTVVGGSTATTTVDFNGIAANPGSDRVTTPPPYAISGYAFSDAFHPITNLALGAFGGIVNNGTPMISLEPQSDDPLTMVLATSGTFSLEKIDAAPLWKNNSAASAAGFPNATELDVIGITSSGTQLTAAFALLPNSFSTLTFTGAWTGLTSVVFTDRVSAVSPVPEPSSTALLAAGLVALRCGLSRRRARTSRPNGRS